jgi:hypothetical protein
MPAPERRRYAVPTRKPRLRGLEPATCAAQNRPFALAARVEPFSNGFRPIMNAPLLPLSCCRSSLSMLMPGAAPALAAAGPSSAGSRRTGLGAIAVVPGGNSPSTDAGHAHGDHSADRLRPWVCFGALHQRMDRSDGCSRLVGAAARQGVDPPEKCGFRLAQGRLGPEIDFPILKPSRAPEQPSHLSPSCPPSGAERLTSASSCKANADARHPSCGCAD